MSRKILQIIVSKEEFMHNLLGFAESFINYLFSQKLRGFA